MASFTLKIDSPKSLQNVVTNLIDAAFERQRESPGKMDSGRGHAAPP